MNNPGIAYFIFVFMIGNFLLSCNPIETVDEQHFSDIASVIVTKNGEKCMENTYSLFIFPALDTLPEGTCGFASYTVNFDNQHSNLPPFISRLISWNTLDTSAFRYMSGSIADTYKDTVLSIASNLNIEQFMFLSVSQKVPGDYIYDYELLCCKDSVDKNNIITMYLKPKLDSQGIDTTAVSRNSTIVFNMQSFWEDQIQQGKDTIKFNIKFSYRTDSIGNPVYTSYKSNPVKIIVTK